MFSLKIRIRKKTTTDVMLIAMFIILVLTGVLVSKVIPGLVVAAVYMLIVFFLLAIIIPIINKRNIDYTSLVLFPTVLTVFQNVFWGLLIGNISSQQLRYLLVINFIAVGLISMVIYIVKSKEVGRLSHSLMTYLCILTCYALLLRGVYYSDMGAFFASYRNIVACILFLLFGYLLSCYCDIDRYYRGILIIVTIVLCVGFYEIFINDSMWISLNIGELWTKKGMRVETWGFPPNFISSEAIMGQRIRRMAATFADPVNLGTFLLFGTIIAWYKKKRILVLLSLIACALTVSKGALLGVLIFMCVHTFYYDRTKLFAGLIFLITAIVGLSFLSFAKDSSSGSVFLHISGFVSSITNIVQEPLGYGCGNVGVMSQVLSVTSNEEITESGLGAIIGQLGIVGLGVYMCFFANVFSKIKSFGEDVRQKIMLMSLFYSIIANMMFNEVALSPNSCGVYFILIGVLIAKRESELKCCNKGEIE